MSGRRGSLPGEVLGHPLHPALGDVERGDICPRRGKLHRLATGRGAEVEHALAFAEVGHGGRIAASEAGVGRSLGE